MADEGVVDVDGGVGVVDDDVGGAADVVDADVDDPWADRDGSFVGDVGGDGPGGRG